jgi:hypothetical protein
VQMPGLKENRLRVRYWAALALQHSRHRCDRGDRR